MKKITRFHGTYEFLSNFYTCLIVYEGIHYPSVEHAFQAAKTTDKRERKVIASLPTPGMAKRKGRRLELRPDWEDIKLDVMLTLLREKFQAHTELGELLVGTYPMSLIEGNTWGDRFWGMVWDGTRWQGENHLGRLLEQVREEIMNAD